MARIRLFVPTYRRPTLLRRALESLRAQTCPDWVAEVHNDDPADDAPRRLLDELADPRLILNQHPENWGAVRVFNHAYACMGPEPFGAILEDDNWWEPDFLAAALTTLEARPDAVAVWSNMRLWHEQADGTWSDSGRMIWPVAATDQPQEFAWPQPIQFSDAIHSHGAMLFRAAASRTALVPSDTPLAIIEHTRERLLGGTWLLLARPLANFAVTRTTARNRDRTTWARAQLLVAASFLSGHPEPAVELARQWRLFRAQHPSPVPVLFHLAFAGVETTAILRHATLAEWTRFLLGSVRHPLVFLHALSFRSAYSQCWEALRAGASARHAEARARPRGSAPDGLTERKHPPQPSGHPS